MRGLHRAMRTQVAIVLAPPTLEIGTHTPYGTTFAANWLDGSRFGTAAEFRPATESCSCISAGGSHAVNRILRFARAVGRTSRLGCHGSRRPWRTDSRALPVQYVR